MKRLAALLPLLSACGDPPAKADDRIECAVDGAAEFARICTIERLSDRSGLVLTIRSPSGSFRRLAATSDGRGVMAADGAEEAAVRVIGEDLIEVSIGSDRYRLPARTR